MSYQTIASKYRSRTFKDLVGQKSVSLALMGSITQGRIPSGVIFSGTRGVGKTSLARIYAKALNCEGKTRPEPCGECHSCRAITEGHHEDVIEIDGASNNGVDEVRALKESTAYVPQRSPYRIYLIDEVHMLSISAFNALLKTLEEPPPHVVFLFATTELDKVPQTVISRCQTFRLQKIPQAEIIQRLSYILEKENITFEEGLLPAIAREGRGSLRDAITFLDQVIALSGSHLTKSSLSQILGNLGESSYVALLTSLLERDGPQCLELIKSFDEQSVSFLKTAECLATLTRHAFVLKALPDSGVEKEDFDLEEPSIESLKKLPHGGAQLNLLFKNLTEAMKDLRESSMDRYVFENACLSWCLREESQKVPSVTSVQPATKVVPLEKISSEALLEPPQTAEKKKATETLAKTSQVKEIPEEPQLSQESPQEDPLTFPKSWKELVERWKQIKPLQARKLEEIVAHEYTSERIVLLVDEHSLVGPTFLKEETRKKVAIVLAKLFNFKGELIVKAQGSESLSPEEENRSPLVGESLLDEKKRLQSAKEKQTATYLEQHELTRGLCEKFDGRVTETYVDV